MRCKYMNKNEDRFDYKEWQTDIKKWFGNMEYLKSSARISFVNGKMKIEFQNAPAQYKDALTKLTLTILDGALCWIKLTYTHNVRVEDIEMEKKRFEKEFFEKAEVLLNTFLTSGLESFNSLLETFSTIYRQKYELDHLYYKNGEWYNFEGYRWNNSAWEKEEDGQKLYAPADDYIKMILPVKETVQKKENEN